MKLMHPGLSKKSTRFKLLFGLFLPAFAFALVLSHETDVRAELPPKAFETPIFPACKGIPLMSQRDYLDYLDDHMQPDPRIQVLPEELPDALTIHDSMTQDEFFRKISGRIHEYLYVSEFHAEMLEACIPLLESGDGTWFRQLHRDPNRFVPWCARELGSLITGVEERWSKMRIALSLSALRVTEDRILGNIDGDIGSRIDSHPQHPLSNVAKMPPLTPEEQAEALAQLDAEERRLRDRGADPYLPFQIEPFRRTQKQLYWKILEEQPILVLVTTGNPNARDFANAFHKIAKNAREALDRLKAKGEAHPELYATYTGLIDQVLAQDPKFCALAHAWEAKLDRDQKISLGVRIGITIATGLSARLAESALTRVAAQLIGLGTSTSYVFGNFHDYQIAEAKALSSAINQEGIANFENLSRERQRLILSGVFLSGKFFSAKVGPSEMREVSTRLFGGIW